MTNLLECILFSIFVLSWPFSSGTALDDYVYEPDPNYSFSLLSTRKMPDYTFYVLNMTSQKLNESIVNNSIWTHQMTITVPNFLQSNQSAFLMLNGYWFYFNFSVSK
jgi:PhoPQ-activated pathogenicity-related protein